jgi:hypothetical protein
MPIPARLPLLPALDATDPRQWPAVVNRLCADLGHPLPVAAPRTPSPYPGLRPFTGTDVPRFYGRDAEVGALLGHLRHSRFVLVAGPSGAGKTSLVQAGFIPQLPASLYWPPGFWVVRTLRPGVRPVQALAEALQANHSDPRAVLTDLLAAHFPAGRLLLVIDPFEELFTLSDGEEQRRFLAALRTLQADARCALLLVMRSDFYPDLMTSDLWPIGVSRRLEVAPLQGTALRQAIQQPALHAGVQVDGDLLARLMADAATEPDPLPLLQETLTALWATQEGRLLTLRAYQEIAHGGTNGLAAVFTARLEARFHALPPEQQALARRICLRLVQPGAGRPDTRRPQTVADLSALDDDPALFAATLRALVEGHIVAVDGPLDDAATTADLAHEVLIIRWPTLRTWLRERQEAEQARRDLDPQTQAWALRALSQWSPLPPLVIPDNTHPVSALVKRPARRTPPAVPEAVPAPAALHPTMTAVAEPPAVSAEPERAAPVAASVAPPVPAAPQQPSYVAPPAPPAAVEQAPAAVPARPSIPQSPPERVAARLATPSPDHDLEPTARLSEAELPRNPAAPPASDLPRPAQETAPPAPPAAMPLAGYVDLIPTVDAPPHGTSELRALLRKGTPAYDHLPEPVRALPAPSPVGAGGRTGGDGQAPFAMAARLVDPGLPYFMTMTAHGNGAAMMMDEEEITDPTDEEQEAAREQAIAAARFRLARLAQQRAADQQRLEQRAVWTRRLRWIGLVVGGVVLLLLLGGGTVWLLVTVGFLTL